MSELGPTLETPRLTLRPIRGEDFDAWAEMMADESTRFIGGPQNRAAAWRGFATFAGAWVVKGFSMFSVIERTTGRWVGRVGPWAPEGWPGTEIGWGLARAAWGRGYATEAATATMDWAFDTLDWTDIIHTIHPENVGSQAVAERLGAVNRGEGQLPEPFQAFRVDVWGQTRDEWRARRR